MAFKTDGFNPNGNVTVCPSEALARKIKRQKRNKSRAAQRILGDICCVRLVCRMKCICVSIRGQFRPKSNGRQHPKDLRANCTFIRSYSSIRPTTCSARPTFFSFIEHHKRNGDITVITNSKFHEHRERQTVRF